jgi:S-adenosylmethionine synthetase
MPEIVIRENDSDYVEVVERKCAGHPDHICDALVETFSRGLCHEYQQRCGRILHHNVDKALLCSGSASPVFNGGVLLSPIKIILAGQATATLGGKAIPVREIAVEGCREWLGRNLHALDPKRDVDIDVLVRPGSVALQDLFLRRSGAGAALANDTSIGVGYAPLSALERLVLKVDETLHARDRRRENLSWGEDIKIMAVRRGSDIALTVSCAMIGRFLANIDHYFEQKALLAGTIQSIAKACGFPETRVTVNGADDRAAGSIYLTVTGTSAESGDDGQVGRGNRVNGLITPYRSMSLEAAAGKNPASHVGKVYNVLAIRIAETVVSNLPAVERAQCLLVSQIGTPVSDPSLVDIRLAMKDDTPVSATESRVAELAREAIADLPRLVALIVSGEISLY